MKIVVIIAFIAIIGSLASAGFYLMRGDKDDEDDERRSRNMAWALALRVGLSIALFLLILLAWKLGYIRPAGIPVGQ
ncbi:MAG: putative transmembrane protein [Burkholderiaceae bacterium]|jgi:purine-cytosine permease-like protein|nr:MAG: putative transmembrane protein [Burkholderiaceae bacterium]